MQLDSIRRSLATGLIALCALAGPAFAQSVTCHLEWAPMRDGVRLATEVYLPAGQSGPLPVVLQRTPYNRSPTTGVGSNCNNVAFTALSARGYAVLNQDVRGRYRSQGVMNAMVQEGNDGYDAIEWAAAQPWSNGKVATTGGSYVGLTQWQPAIRVPPHLVAIAPSVTASDYHDNWTYVNAAFDLWFAQSWMLVTFGGEQYMRNLEANGASPAEVVARTQEWEAQGAQDILTKWVWTLPLTSFDVFRQGNPLPLAPYYYDWLAHPSYDAFWAYLDVETRWQEVKVPALNFSGWYDIFQVGSFRNFQHMRNEAGTVEARAGTKLVVSCCGHAGTSGNLNWGPSHTDATLQNRFYDHYLKGMDTGLDRDPVVQMDVLVPPDTGNVGTSFLATASQFPLPGTETVKFNLASGGHANTSNGDGVLVVAGGAGHGNRHRDDDDDDAGGPPDRFTYDPRNPVPTKGGNMCCDPAVLPAGAHDQSQVELREDVLVYTSAPLDNDVAVIGPVTVKLWANTSARDTDFTAKLVDVHLDGYAHNVLDRIVRARYRMGSKIPPSLIHRGKPYEYTIDLGNAGTIFRKGHRVRLEISSSNFPHYARNLNTGDSNETTARMEAAHQTILHDPEHASQLLLSVAPGVRPP